MGRVVVVAAQPTMSDSTASPSAATDVSAADSARKPKDKLRSAWISFAGRIVAQLIGAMATVVLGVYVANAYAKHVRVTEAGATAAAPAESALQPASTTPVVRARHGEGLALVVLPFQDYTPAAASAHVANGLTEALTSTLARSGQVQVISRTSATHFSETRAPLPAIAAALAVDLVVEGSISRQGNRVRVTVQLIDAHADEHLWAQTYDRSVDDVLALEADVSAAIGRDLTAVLPRTTLGRGTPATASSPPPSATSRWLFAGPQ